MVSLVEWFQVFFKDICPRTEEKKGLEALLYIVLCEE